MFSNKFNFDFSENELSKLLSKKKKEGRLVLDLTQSNPLNSGIGYEKEKILNSLISGNTFSYNPSPKGLCSAREAVSEYYRQAGFNVDSENIFLTSGTSEAYSYLFKLLCNPGEEILVPQPSYPLIDTIAEIENVKSVRYNLKYDGKWLIDINDLKKRISKQTKAILIINPNNPTGSYVSREDYIELDGLCLENNLALISDEVFYDFNINGEKKTSSAGNNSCLTFTLSGISKICGLPQLKLSWIITDGTPQVKSDAIKRLEILTDAFLCVNTPVQEGLDVILKTRFDFQNKLNALIRKNLEFLQKSVIKSKKLEVLLIEGGWYSVVKILDNTDDENMCLRLLEDKDVYVHPGYFFDFEENCFFVISLITKYEIFSEGIERITKMHS